MDDKVKNAGIIIISAAAVVTASTYVYSSVVKDNKKVTNTTATAETVKAAPTIVKNKYLDGKYTVRGDYATNNNTINHKMEVVITLDDDRITAASTKLIDDKPNAKAEESNAKFSTALKTTVVGQKLDEAAEISTISGSSDTTTGFKTAVQAVQVEAKSE